MAFKKRIPCPVCVTKDMDEAGVDLGPFRERARSGEVIEVVHVYYGCDDCGTTVKLRFRKDGKEGDLWREMKRRKAAGGVLEDFGGKIGDIG